MTLPEPELADQGEWCLAGGVDEFFGGEWHWSCVEETAAEADEGDDQDELERVGEVVGDLRGDYVEAEDER